MSADPARPEPDFLGGDAGLSKGASIGRYVVLGLVGRGGMGEVYAAYDPGAGSQGRGQAAARARRTAEALSEGRTRLLREAQAIARLSHPNVVVVYDVGTFEEKVFIAMEFVEGNTLGYWIAGTKRKLAGGPRGLSRPRAAGCWPRTRRVSSTATSNPKT